ncbi:MAG: ChpI protein [Tolypothrix carrinoi HA7290-LM1]|nr:ChpI protein [Tolypothrix carrinoi HA7290-LM1]
MKTAISIPDTIFEAAENFAKRMGLSRSELYAVALQEYLKAHRSDAFSCRRRSANGGLRLRITEQLDAVYADEDSSLNPFLVELQTHTLLKETW